jgi:FAD/FMN-containing dehydrogenase
VPDGDGLRGPPVSALVQLHRDAVWLMAYDASWTKRDTRRTIRRSLDWLARFDDEVRPFLSSQTHQNFTDRTLHDWRTAYYGDAYPRLQAIKRAVDPDGVFRFPQAV